MANAKVPQLLVVAGDYDIAHFTQQVLQNERFSLQAALTHRDALYSLENARFDAVLIDAAMFDRHSNEVTLTAVARMNQSIPLIAFDLYENASPQVVQLADALIDRLDKSTLVHTVRDALRLASLSDEKEMAQTSRLTPDAALSRRIDELRTLFVLSQSLTEVLDLTEVLNRVVEAARRLTNADEGMILLPDDEAGQLYLRARVGIDVEVARNFRIKTQDTLAGQVFHSGQPVLVGDQGPQKVKTEYFVNSLLYLPILLKGQPIGVLGVNNKNKQDVFNLDHQELLMNLASYAAIAIENARIHEESLQRARELETLVEVSQALNSSLSLREILPRICRQLAQILNVNQSEIYEWNKDSNCLVSLARFSRKIWRFGQGPLIHLRRQPGLQESITHNRPFWLTYDDAAFAEEAEILKMAGAVAMLAAPIYSQDRMLGVLRLFYMSTAAAAPQADVIQSALHLALEGFAGVLAQVEETRPKNVFRVLEKINQLTAADWCDLSITVNEGAGLRVHSEVGSGLWLNSSSPVIDLSRFADLLKLMRSKAPIHEQMGSGTLTPGVRAVLETTSGRAILGLPLIQRGEPNGAVFLTDTERSREFSKRDMDMARAIVGQASTALENAHLFRDLELSLQELKDTQDRLVQTARLSAMGELAAVVAHQINNPLTTIVVDTDLLMLDEPKDSPNYNTMLAISRAGKRAAGVAKRLLAIARPNDPDTPTEPIDVVDTIKGVLSLVKTHIERDRIQILGVEDLPEEPLPRVQAVRGQLDDVWLNLLLNAHDALLGRANAVIGIEVRYNSEESHIDVEVWDNGPGIPDHVKKEVFNPFFTTKPVGEGTGLGLHICRQVVERVGGKIWVESQLEQGTRFWVRLPVRVENWSDADGF